MYTELFIGNLSSTTVTQGGMSSPKSGTEETLTVSAEDGVFPAVRRNVEQFHFKDANPEKGGEIFRCIETDNNHWAVIRGAEGTRPVVHDRGFTVRQVVTAGFYQRLGMGSTTELLNAVSVFGIDRTGSEDAGAPLSTALSAGPVYLPTGDYLLKSPLNVPPGAVLLSFGSPTLVADSGLDADAAIELIEDSSHTRLENFTLDGSRLGAGTEVCGILSAATELDVELRGLRINGFPGEGIVGSGCNYVLERVSSNGNYSDGFVLVDGGLLIGCRAIGNAGYGYDIDDGKLIGCIASGNRKGDYRTSKPL